MLVLCMPVSVSHCPGPCTIELSLTTYLSGVSRSNAKAPAVHRQDDSALTEDAMTRAVSQYRRRKQDALEARELEG